MKIYSIICTRDKELKPVTKELVDKLSSLPAKVILMVNQESIFSGYKKAFESVNPEDTDIFILCHDDIEILSDIKIFKNALETHLSQYKSGFAGVAGTTFLDKDAVWWNHDRWKAGLHRGHVFHGKSPYEYDNTYYGPPDQVVAMDGLFLAATAKTLEKVGLDKPEYFEGEWDFYDIHYTTKAHQMGLINKVVPIMVLHNSFGELAGRESWHKNREAFIKNTELPIKCK